MNNDNSDEMIGAELVNILYKNTLLNYDACALNLIEIFDHLGSKVPGLSAFSQHFINSMQVIVFLNSNFLFFQLLKFLY